MENITITRIPLKHILSMFFAGLIGASVCGIIFGLIGLVFAKYLGFPMILGAEEIIMGESAIFYSTLTTPIGALIGLYFAKKVWDIN